MYAASRRDRVVCEHGAGTGDEADMVADYL